LGTSRRKKDGVATDGVKEGGFFVSSSQEKGSTVQSKKPLFSSFSIKKKEKRTYTFFFRKGDGGIRALQKEEERGERSRGFISLASWGEKKEGTNTSITL